MPLLAVVASTIMCLRLQKQSKVRGWDGYFETLPEPQSSLIKFLSVLQSWPTVLSLPPIHTHPRHLFTHTICTYTHTLIATSARILLWGSVAAGCSARGLQRQRRNRHSHHRRIRKKRKWTGVDMAGIISLESPSLPQVRLPGLHIDKASVADLFGIYIGLC